MSWGRVAQTMVLILLQRVARPSSAWAGGSSVTDTAPEAINPPAISDLALPLTRPVAIPVLCKLAFFRLYGCVQPRKAPPKRSLDGHPREQNE